MFDTKAGCIFIFISCCLALSFHLSDCLKPVEAKHHLKHRDEVEEDFPYNYTRLPRNILPHSYRVYLHTNLTTFRIKGRVGILIYCKEETRQIILHSKDNTITKVTLATGNVRDLERMENSTDSNRIIKIRTRKESKKLEFLLLELEQALKTQDWYTLIISFRGKLESKLEGFYKSTYKTKKGETRHIATTQFQATAARSAFPCFDEPDMKAKFKINLVREERHVALSNMPIEKTVTLGNGLFQDQFKESVKMSTYLVAFVICDFKYKEATTKGGVKVRVWAPEDQIDQAEIAIDAAPKILDHYNEFFGVPFPLPKQDLVAIPDFSAGAMENWGLITYRETALLYDPKKSSTSHKQWVVVVIAHELAHQWFGNLVTMKWWNDLWLNEGFASYVEFLGTAHYNSSWKMMDQFTVEDIHGSMQLDALSNSHPISVDVDNPSQISELFDLISYHKGASVIRMLAHFIGNTAFHNGLKHYLERHRYDNAETDDLWQELAKTSSVDVKNVMDTWTRQMGFPLVTIVRDPENPDKAIATQEHFLEDPSATVSATSPFNYKWEVPLTYMMKSGTKTTINSIKWMTKDGAPLKFPWTQADGWIKGNIRSYGYYRCNYDESNWRALARQLKEDHTVFSAIDRANLIDDACAIARSEKLNQILALELTTYMEKETDYVPLVTALSCLGNIGATLDERPGHKYYKAYIVKILKPVMSKLGWEDTGSHLNKKLREKVLYSAVMNGDENSINKLRQMFKDWKENDKELPANLMGSVHLAGIKYGTQEDWDFVWEKQKSSHVAIEKSDLIHVLTTTKDPSLLRRYLNYAIDDSKVRQQDGATVIVLIGRNKAGRQLAWDFLKRKWDVIFERYGESSYDFSDLLKSIGGRFTSEEKLNEVKAFYESHDLASGQRAAKQAIEEIKSSIDWLKKHEQEVVDWFKSKTSE